ncbi:hypothetical protein K3495_g7682 [Podosphaera aphanis]|nr:hypothetical protein K3495_g7682 [Podosphaera aphanis]
MPEVSYGPSAMSIFKPDSTMLLPRLSSYSSTTPVSTRVTETQTKKSNLEGRSSHPAWTLSDDNILINARASGKEWKDVQRDNFPLKTPNACRKRYERLMKRKNVNGLDRRRLENLAKKYMRLREEIWKPLTLATGEKLSDVESTCMGQGLEGLREIARSTAEVRSSGAVSSKLPFGDLGPGRLDNSLISCSSMMVSNPYEGFESHTV